MELGKNDLLEEIRERKNVQENKAGVWFYQLHGGMMYMHSKGIVHRDLKCENLLLDEGQNLKITDFGFARKVIKNKLGEIKFSETYCGSYAYAAPEILKGVPYDPYTPDVWSIGVILFTMLYGRLPFDDSNHKKLLKQVQSRIVFPAKPEVSEECRILILKMLNKASERVPLANIRYDPWYKKYLPSSLDVSEPGSTDFKKVNFRKMWQKSRKMFVNQMKKVDVKNIALKL
ncbi:hypothetical protein KUTeg_019113 [Tegillarca granosa]|uniref:Protein kinase domain-containing protein n=1 Tax=Tegillarca granosa TaxID=220873 RepID=A0ABQ9EFN1_TEGGR|nr:hypothetical protein KUTeg_019113 [Tegillarca granosa]